MKLYKIGQPWQNELLIDNKTSLHARMVSYSSIVFLKLVTARTYQATDILFNKNSKN